VEHALAGLAAQAIGKALWEGAEALAEYATGIALAANPLTAALAPGHFLAATAHGVAAAAYGVLGGASALVGRAVAGSAFSDSGASAGSGSVAGSAFGSGTSNNDPKVITENRNQWQQKPIPPHPEATVHVVVHSSTDTGAIQNVVGAYIEHPSGRTQVVNAITHEYHNNNERLTGMLQHAVER
jgi:hypothetical protein